MHDGFVGIAKHLPCDLARVEVSGHAAYLLMPHSPQRKPAPWVWYAPTFEGGNPREETEWMFRKFLERGIAVAGVDVGESYGSPAGSEVFSAFYDVLVRVHDMARRPVLLPQSRGGLMHYNWAAANPDKLAAIAGIFPVCDLRSYPGLDKACGAYEMDVQELAARLPEHNPVERAEPLAKAGVPVLHLHGDSDTIVPLEKNSAELQRRYRAFGGDMRVIVVPGKGHEVVPAFFESDALTEFAVKWASRRT